MTRATPLPASPASGQLNTQLLALVTAAAGWAALQAALALKIPDLLEETPMRVTELAERTGTGPARLAQLVAVLHQAGIVHRVGDDLVEHTAASRALRRTGGDPSARWITADWIAVAWGRLADGLRGHGIPFELAHQRPFFDYLAETPAAADTFHNAVTRGRGSALTDMIAATVDLTGATTLADIGGGQGELLVAVLARNPGLAGILFDLPAAVRSPLAALVIGEMAARTEIRTGDVLREAPAGVDVYLLRSTLHMLDDPDCVAALTTIRKAAAPASRIVLVEMLTDDWAQEGYTALSSLQMFVLSGGRERSEREFVALLERAGLVFHSATPTGTPYRLIEARVVSTAPGR
ncbi:methyltransferase [Amycolatopsis minnesotensis]|uniref:Methyltransferase n=1 Tax=Amycolatopsis minnesotensis TaxID=337894 RepID=A0ABN2QW20_9PSEU